MQLSDQAIHEFEKLYFTQYGVKISRDQATEYGGKLIGLVKVVYGERIPKSLDDKSLKGYDKHGHN